MVQSKASITKNMASESEHAIQFLAVISNVLKHQRRHFDDAVVTHCIRLIHEYVGEQTGGKMTDDQPVNSANPQHL